MKFVAPLLLGLSLNSHAVVSAEGEKECKEVEMINVSYYSMTSVDENKKIAAIYKEKVNALKDFSKKHQLNDFKILSHDISVNPNNYYQGSSELSISIYFESEFDYALLDKIRDELNLNNFSANRTINSICK